MQRHQYDRETPAFAAEILSKFGTNDYGEPIFRIVWSETQFETMGGVYEERANPMVSSHITKWGQMLVDSNPVVRINATYKTVTKYPDFQGDKARWILEKWKPCSYSPAQWDYEFLDRSVGIYLSGPYPERGEYWFSKVLTVRGDYLEVTAEFVEYYARLIAAGDEYSDVQKQIAMRTRRERAQKDKNNQFDAVFHDAMPVGGVTAAYSGPGKKTNRRSVDDVKILPVPTGLPTTGGSRQL